MKTLLLFTCFIAAHVAECFVIQAHTNRFALRLLRPTDTYATIRLYMSDDEKQTTNKEDVAVASSDTPSMSNENQTQYPLDIPSPILLATSMLLAISSVGSLFQMMDSSVTPMSAAIALIGLPLCPFFFYAAITKAQAETEADDKAFLRDQRGVRNPNDFFN